ncbi:Predicted PurR-regulated permease PerM [Chitinophaga sp. YR627]|uniref:AI-2E family transporter n=1 Tax=Chitinophaga sp. YR627 TaxID=1881041 RepID=UPI0008F1E8A6|nr:AI-2E family transporter [Chitinophaga sp. YR627]SFO58867.1 Predicted PurR-regulated permease PerM [Chitinophaga sp. YR627]
MMIYRTKAIDAAAILMILALIVLILVYGKPFFVPIAFAGLLAMLLLPVSRWLHAKGINNAVAILLSILLFVGFLALVVLFVSWQISDIAENASQLEQQLMEKYQQLQAWLSTEYGISQEKQAQVLKEQQESSSGKASAVVTGIISGFGGFLTDLLLVLVYVFLFTFFRSRIKGFIVRLVPHSEKEKAIACIHKTQETAQKYLKGLLLMIIFLWVMYGIGFSVVGVKNAFFFAILCGLLEIIPFVGNLTGTALTLLMSLVQGGDMTLVVGILVTYGLVQFIQSYLLEPLVVGSGVDINPMATIVGLVAGELLWGIPGMVMAIPLMGMMKVVFDHIPVMQPYAYLLGQDKKDSGGWKKFLKIFKKGS